MTKQHKNQAVLFLISQSITLFGSTLVQMAVVWYATVETSSGTWVAVFTFCSWVPQFLISIPGGVWADRLSKKRLIITPDILTATVTLLMIFLLGRLPGTDSSVVLAALLIMSVIRSFCAGIQTPAVNASLPLLVPEKELLHFNGINAGIQSLVQFAAPAAAGIVLSSGTLEATLFLDILTAVPGIALLCAVRFPTKAEDSAHIPRSDPRTSSARKQPGFFSDLLSGIRYALRETPVRRLLFTYGCFVILCVPAGFLAGLLVSRVYGDSYGYLTAVELAGFAGMTAGGILMSLSRNICRKINRNLSRKTDRNLCRKFPERPGNVKFSNSLSAGLAVFGLSALLMSLTPDFRIYLLLMFLYGIALTAVQTAVTTLLQKTAASSMQGRMFGLLSSIYSGFMPLGMAVFGPMADGIPLPWIMAGSGFLLLMLSRFAAKRL